MHEQKAQKNYENTLRFNTSYNVGLDDEQIKERKKQKLTNKTFHYNQKNLKTILFNNVLTIFNLAIIFVTVLFIISGKLNNIYFFIVTLLAIVLGAAFDIHVHIFLAKSTHSKKFVAIRNWKETVVKSRKIVLDDIVLLKENDVISFDAEIVEGVIVCDTSYINGFSKTQRKQPGDKLYSGERIVSGSAYVKVIEVGVHTSESIFNADVKTIKYKKSNLTKLLNKVSIFVGVLLVLLFVLSLISLSKTINVFDIDEFKNSSTLLISQLFNITPYALYFLIDISLVFSLFTLRKIKAHVLDFRSLEALSQVDMVVFDKTGTISDRELEVFKTIPFGNRSYQEISQIVSNVLNATEGDDILSRALSKTFTYDLTNLVNTVLQFNTTNNYFGAAFKGGRTYLIGDLDSFNLVNQTATMSHANEYVLLGYRVLAIVETNGKIDSGKVVGDCAAIGLIVLKERIKNNAIEVIKYLKEQNIDIRVVSGDNPYIASEIARQAEISNSDKYVSIKDKNDVEIELLFENFTVFGDANAEQKRIIVERFQDKGKKVLMIGDGLNDCLALKQADCSFAMGDGCSEAKNVSKVVLADSNLLSIPALFAKGKRTTNNVKRIIAFNLLKPIFVGLLALTYTLFNLFGLETVTSYPFMANSLLICDMVIIIGSLLFAFDFNHEKVQGNLGSGVLKNVISSSLMIVGALVVTLLLKEFNKNNLFYSNVADNVMSGETVTASAINTMVQIVLLILMVIAFIRLCNPINKYRLISIVVLAVFTCSIVGIYALLYYLNKTTNSFDIYFCELNLMNYFEILIICLCFATIYLSITQIFISFKKEK